MSRLLKLLGMALGGFAIFAVFALAGWALTDLLAGEDEVEDVDTVAMTEYPLQPAEDDIEAQMVQLGAEQELTEEGLTSAGGEGVDDTIDGQGSLGSAAAGGQTIRLVERSTVEFEEPSDDDPTPDSEEPIPADVFADLPRLLGGLDLTEIQVADLVGPILIDVCAGPERLPQSPEGCSFGFGGTIVPLSSDFDDDSDYGVSIILAPEGECEVSGDSTMSLVVYGPVPGTINLTLWQGPPDSDSPPEAFFAQYTTPAELTATMIMALDAGESDLSSYCIEVPIMTGGLVAEHFLFSSYPPHGDAPGWVYRDYLSAESNRPPSSMTPFGSDALYVQTFRSPTERVWVKAVESEPGIPTSSVCNTDGRAIGARGPTPNGMPEADVVARLVDSTLIDVYPTWPYGSKYNTVDTHQLNLESGRNYAVCSYVQSTLPFGGIVFSESAVVGTPTARGIDVALIFVGGGAESSVELRAFQVITPCGNEGVAYPDTPYPPRIFQPLCWGDFLVSDVLRDGGFPVTIQTDSLEVDEPALTHGWIPVDTSDILCGTACGGDLDFVVRIPVRGFDLTESRRQTAEVGYVTLEVTLTSPTGSSGSTTWDLGSLDVYDNTNPELPEYPRIFTRFTDQRDRVEDGELSASMNLTIYADRPVEYTATVDPTFPTCGGSTTGVFEGRGRIAGESLGSELFKGLCFGVLYPVIIEAVDADGARTTNTYHYFTDTSLTVAISAELQLEALPPAADDATWGQRFGRADVMHTPSWPIPGYAPRSVSGSSAPWSFGRLSLEPTGWKSYQESICDGDTTPPFPRTWTIRAPLRSLDWSVSTTVTRYTSSGGQPIVACEGVGRASEDVEYLRIAASGLTLKELLEGVTITTETEYGTISMRVSTAWFGR